MNGLTKISGTQGGNYYYDPEGNVYRSQSSGPELVTDPWTRQYKRRAQERQSERRLGLYDEESTKFRDSLSRDFRVGSEYTAARQVGGVQASLGQYLQRQGLEGGIAASLTQATLSDFAGKVAQANMDFQSRLGQLLYAERQGFLKGEFDFMRRLEAMSYGQELSKDMARFQAQLQSDLQSKSMFQQFLGTAATIGGLALFGPAALAAPAIMNSAMPVA